MPRKGKTLLGSSVSIQMWVSVKQVFFSSGSDAEQKEFFFNQCCLCMKISDLNGWQSTHWPRLKFNFPSSNINNQLEIFSLKPLTTPYISCEEQEPP